MLNGRRLPRGQFKILIQRTRLPLKVRPARPNISECPGFQRILVGPKLCHRIIPVHNDDAISSLPHPFQVVTELITKFPDFDIHVAKFRYNFG